MLKFRRVGVKKVNFTIRKYTFLGEPDYILVSKLLIDPPTIHSLSFSVRAIGSKKSLPWVSNGHEGSKSILTWKCLEVFRKLPGFEFHNDRPLRPTCMARQRSALDCRTPKKHFGIKMSSGKCLVLRSKCLVPIFVIADKIGSEKTSQPYICVS